MCVCVRVCVCVSQSSGVSVADNRAINDVTLEKEMAPLQYSCLGNPTDRGAWQATVHEVTKSWTRLSN